MTSFSDKVDKKVYYFNAKKNRLNVVFTLNWVRDKEKEHIFLRAEDKQSPRRRTINSLTFVRWTFLQFQTMDCFVLNTFLNISTHQPIFQELKIKKSRILMWAINQGETNALPHDIISIETTCLLLQTNYFSPYFATHRKGSFIFLNAHKL